MTPHVAQAPHSAIDARTTRHPGYAISQRHRKRVEEIFGWMKTIGGLRKLRHRGTDRVEWQFLFVAAVYAAVSSMELTPVVAAAVLRRQWLLRDGLLAFITAWAVVSLAELPPAITLSSVATWEMPHVT